MVNELVLIPIEQLRDMIHEVVSSLLSNPSESPAPLPEKLSVEMALAYFNEHGCRMSKANLYRLTSTKQIPHSKFGKKILFNRSELSAWIESQTKHPTDKTEAIKILAENAQRKLDL